MSLDKARKNFVVDENKTTLPCARKDYETVLALVKQMRSLPRQLWLTFSHLESFAQFVCCSQQSGRAVPLVLVEEAIGIAEESAKVEAQIGSSIRTWANEDNYIVGQAKWTDILEIFGKYLEVMRQETGGGSLEFISTHALRLR
jgi:hypothetical protein